MKCSLCSIPVAGPGAPLVYEPPPPRRGGAGRAWCVSCAHVLGVGSEIPSLEFRAWVETGKRAHLAAWREERERTWTFTPAMLRAG